MPTHLAECRCGLVTARCEGEPVRVSVCHCLACQRRSGSAFSAQVRFATEAVTITGEVRVFERRADSGNMIRDRFCPACGSTIAYLLEDQPELTAVPLGAFVDPAFSRQPRFSVYERRKHAWVSVLGEAVQHIE